MKTINLKLSKRLNLYLKNINTEHSYTIDSELKYYVCNND